MGSRKAAGGVACVTEIVHVVAGPQINKQLALKQCARPGHGQALVVEGTC